MDTVRELLEQALDMLDDEGKPYRVDVIIPERVEIDLAKIARDSYQKNGDVPELVIAYVTNFGSINLIPVFDIDQAIAKLEALR